MNKKYSKWIRIIGIILFLFILTRLDFNTTIKNLINFKWEYLIIYAILTILMLVFKSIRWQTILIKQEIDYQMKKVYAINTLTTFLGMITPGRIGELSKVIYLQEDKIPFSKSIVSVLIDRAYDLIILMVFGVVAFFFFANLLMESLKTLFVIILLFAGSGTLIFLFKSNIWEILKRVMKFILPEPRYILIASEWALFKAEIIKVFLPTLPKMTFYSILIYCCYYAQINIVAYGFNVSVSFIYLSFCMTMASLVSLLPISIGGLGTREAVFIFLLSKISIPAESAVLISFFDGSIFALIALSILTAISSFLLKDKKELSNE